MAIVGAFQDDDRGGKAGSAYIFQRSDSGAWDQVAKLYAGDPTPRPAPLNQNGNQFGQSVSLSGTTAIVGAPYQGALYTGAAYVFRENASGTWGQVAKLVASDAAENDQFGISVAISGNTAIVGAHHDNASTGAAYVFRETLPGTWSQIARLTAPDGAPGDEFGISVSISGNLAVIGSHQDDTSAGAAYLFRELGPDGWTFATKLTASDAANSDLLGTSVGVFGSTVIVGAPGNDDAGSRSGSAYVFDVAPIPEPSSWLLVLFGLASFKAIRIRRATPPHPSRTGAVVSACTSRS
jgi:hypothetical protein